jgi:hypothetical protein
MLILYGLLSYQIVGKVCIIIIIIIIISDMSAFLLFTTSVEEAGGEPTAPFRHSGGPPVEK